MKFIAKTFNELTTVELYEIMRARAEIFIIEQGMNCRDLDGVDYDSLHCFLWEDGAVRAYLRAFVTDMDTGTVKIGRVLSITHGIGLGTRIMTESIPEIKRRLGCKIVVNAQKHAAGFYEFLGFKATSGEFMEEGIPHVEMLIDC